MARAVADITNAVNASAATTNLSLSPDADASALLSSPMAGLMPELTPSEQTEGILLFLLQVSGPAAIVGNTNLNWALSVNLATRLDYVTVDNLYLLNYTQLPTNTPAGQRRSLLQTSTPTRTPAVGEVSSGVVSLPDLSQETANLSTVGTGVTTSSPSIAFMYEADVGSADYISYVHNQLNSIIATSALLRDVRSANLSVNSIYLVSFEPAYEPNGTNITSYSAPGATGIPTIQQLSPSLCCCNLHTSGTGHCSNLCLCYDDIAHLTAFCRSAEGFNVMTTPVASVVHIMKDSISRLFTLPMWQLLAFPSLLAYQHMHGLAA